MSIRERVEANADRYLSWLTEACSIPSVAERPEALSRMVDWLESRFDALGAQLRRLRYESAPDAVLARLGSGPRTILVYDHYDVQPVDPIDLWRSHPFVPEVRDGRFYARGAADNKGDLVARLAALDAMAEEGIGLPVEVKFIIEGEEETGSGSFQALVNRYGADFAADGCMWEGAGIDHAGRPELVFGAKGLAYVELACRGLNEDQHSSIAVIAPSPVWRLIQALATLRDSEGRILIDGFYDDVRPPTDADLALLAEYPFDDAAERERLGVDEFIGNDRGAELLRRYFFEPTCNLAGVWGGHTVPGGAKTVLPKEAFAKIDMRLVADQDPEDVVAKLRKHLEQRGFADISVTQLGGEHPARSPVDSLVGKAAIAAAEEVFEGQPAVAPVMIATGPMYPVAHTLRIPTVSPAGVCRPDSNIHAPNEQCRVGDFLKTIEYTAAWIEAFARA